MTITLAETIDSLTQLRKKVEAVLAEAEWGMRASHADAEALAFMQLAIGNAAAVEVLAKADMRLVIAGTAAARAAYEEAVTCAWMLAPDDLAERDRRWMALYVEEHSFWKRAAEEAIKRGDPEATVDGLQKEANRVRAAIEEVRDQLEAVGAAAIVKLPNFDVRLEEVGQGRHYVTYKAACQLVHPATRALSQVRDPQLVHADESTVATYSYRTRPKDWTIAIALAAESLAFGLETLESRLPPGRPHNEEVYALFNLVASNLLQIDR